jgi:hypothetical protein
LVARSTRLKLGSRSVGAPPTEAPGLLQVLHDVHLAADLAGWCPRPQGRERAVPAACLPELLRDDVALLAVRLNP